MKLVTFETNGAQHIGAVLADGKTVADFTASSSAPHFRDMLALIDGGDAALQEAARDREVTEGFGCAIVGEAARAGAGTAPDARLPVLRDASAPGARQPLSLHRR